MKLLHGLKHLTYTLISVSKKSKLFLNQTWNFIYSLLSQYTDTFYNINRSRFLVALLFCNNTTQEGYFSYSPRSLQQTHLQCLTTWTTQNKVSSTAVRTEFLNGRKFNHQKPFGQNTYHTSLTISLKRNRFHHWHSSSGTLPQKKGLTNYTQRSWFHCKCCLVGVYMVLRWLGQGESMS